MGIAEHIRQPQWNDNAAAVGHTTAGKRRNDQGTFQRGSHRDYSALFMDQENGGPKDEYIAQKVRELETFLKRLSCIAGKARLAEKSRGVDQGRVSETAFVYGGVYVCGD